MSYNLNNISIQDIQMTNCTNPNQNINTNNHPSSTQSPILPLSNNNSHSNQNQKQKPKIPQNTTASHQFQITITNNHSQYKKQIIGDRFIPQRHNIDNETMSHLLQYQINTHPKSNNNPQENESSQTTLNSMIIDALTNPYNTKAIDTNHIRKNKGKEINNINSNNKYKLLSFSSKQPIHHGGTHNVLHEVNSIIQRQLSINEEDPIRPINTMPAKVLDAPNLIDDYYLNLIDWGKKNIIAVCLSNYLYLWNAETMKTVPLCEETENICSVNWIGNGSCLAVGLNNGHCDLYDGEKLSKIRTMNGHTNRVSSLHWNNYLLSTGSKDSHIVNHDVRCPNHIINTLNSHSREVCSLKWSIDGNLLASGGDDNLVYVWDIRKATQQAIRNIFDMSIDDIMPSPIIQRLTPLYRLNSHKAAVKALAWNPYQRNMLTTGGGTKDQSIKFWDCSYGSLLKSVDTGSQVCSLLWNPHDKELISSHGYTKNQITIWNYMKMTHIADLIGHMNRVLYTSLSPDGNTLMSGAGDESLKIWEINDLQKKNTQAKQEYEQSNQNMCMKEMYLR